MAQEKIEGKFYALQKEELLGLKQAKLINNAALVYFAIKLENPFCDRPITLIIKEFALRWSLPEVSLYKALAKLKELEIINFLAGKVTIKWAKLSNQKKDYQIREKIIKFDNGLSNPIIDYQIRENESSECLPDKGFDSSQTLQTFQTLQTGGEEKKVSETEEEEEKAKENKLTSVGEELLNFKEEKLNDKNLDEDKCSAPPAESRLNNPIKSVVKADQKINEELSEQLRSLDIPLDAAVRKCIESHHISQVEKAIAHIENTWEDVRNPRSIFLYQVPRQEIEKPLKNPLTPEFLQWYNEAIARGKVVNRPAETLPLDRFTEPLVILPDGRQEAWQRVKEGKVGELLSPENSAQFFAGIRAKLLKCTSKKDLPKD